MHSSCNWCREKCVNAHAHAQLVFLGLNICFHACLYANAILDFQHTVCWKTAAPNRVLFCVKKHTDKPTHQLYHHFFWHYHSAMSLQNQHPKMRSNVSWGWVMLGPMEVPGTLQGEKSASGLISYLKITLQQIYWLAVLYILSSLFDSQGTTFKLKCLWNPRQPLQLIFPKLLTYNFSPSSRMFLNCVTFLSCLLECNGFEMKGVRVLYCFQILIYI